MKNDIHKSIFILIILGSFVILTSCKGIKEEAKIEEEEEKQAEIEQNIMKMANSYDAVLDWEKDLRPKDFLTSVYTVEVQRALVREDNRPVLFIADVQDIEKRGNEYTVYFDRWTGYFGINVETYLPILFILKCTEEQVKKILNQPNEILFENYSVIASISDVNRMRFGLTRYSLGEYEANIEIDSSAGFIAKGNCLDLLFVGDFGATEVEKLMKEVLIGPKSKDESDKK